MKLEEAHLSTSLAAKFSGGSTVRILKWVGPKTEDLFTLHLEKDGRLRFQFHNRVTIEPAASNSFVVRM